MKRLIKAEFLKLSGSLGYKVMLLVSLGLGITAGLFGLGGPDMTGYELFTEALTNYEIVVQGHVILFSIYAALFVCNEFKERTLGMSLFSGAVRMHIFFAKAVVYLISLVPIVFIKAIVGAILGTFRNGFGSESLLSLMPEILFLSLCTISGVLAMGCFCLLLAVLIKSVAGTIGAGIGIGMMVMLLTMLPHLQPILKYTFIYQIGQISSLERSSESWLLFIIVIGATTVLSLAAGAFVFEKTELK